MTGPEHYQEAERLAGLHGEWYYTPAEQVPAILARAQVHATLALAAATALSGDKGLPWHERGDWHQAAGTRYMPAAGGDR